MAPKAPKAKPAAAKKPAPRAPRALRLIRDLFIGPNKMRDPNVTVFATILNVTKKKHGKSGVGYAVRVELANKQGQLQDFILSPNHVEPKKGQFWKFQDDTSDNEGHPVAFFVSDKE